MIGCEAQALLASHAVTVAFPATAEGGIAMDCVKLPLVAAFAVYDVLVSGGCVKEIVTLPGRKCIP